MLKKILILLILTIPLNLQAAESNKGSMPKHKWSFNGITGTFDRAALQRGFKVYREVCAGCHSMKLLYYRDLIDIGFSEAQVKSIAAEYDVLDGPNDEGEMFERPARPADRFVNPYLNDNEARANNNGAYPPNQAELLDILIPKILRTTMFRFMLDTNASEHGARMVAMEQATENANELLRDLKLQYNRERQAAITNEILEIVGGAAALEEG